MSEWAPNFKNEARSNDTITNHTHALIYPHHNNKKGGTKRTGKDALWFATRSCQSDGVGGDGASTQLLVELLRNATNSAKGIEQVSALNWEARLRNQR